MSPRSPCHYHCAPCTFSHPHSYYIFLPYLLLWSTILHSDHSSRSNLPNLLVWHEPTDYHTGIDHHTQTSFLPHLLLWCAILQPYGHWHTMPFLRLHQLKGLSHIFVRRVLQWIIPNVDHYRDQLPILCVCTTNNHSQGLPYLLVSWMPCRIVPDCHRDWVSLRDMHLRPENHDSSASSDPNQGLSHILLPRMSRRVVPYCHRDRDGLSYLHLRTLRDCNRTRWRR